MSENEIRKRLADVKDKMNDPEITQPEYETLRQEQIELMRKLNQER